MTLSAAHAAFSPPPSVPRQFRFHSRYAYPFLRAPSGAHRAELRACPSDPFPLEVPGPVSSRIPLDRMRFVKPARGLPSCSAFCRVTPVTPSPSLGGEPALARLAAALCVQPYLRMRAGWLHFYLRQKRNEWFTFATHARMSRGGRPPRSKALIHIWVVPRVVQTKRRQSAHFALSASSGRPPPPHTCSPQTGQC